mmetsp:Transcript_15746/g.34230  ORF Transcript_15746/g.34230 Transcript_15746/m.34230 type:complete len:243 (-) Transcript_15746:816-1544(-)
MPLSAENTTKASLRVGHRRVKRDSRALRGPSQKDILCSDGSDFPIEDRVDARGCGLQLLVGQIVLAFTIEVCEVVVPGGMLVSAFRCDFSVGGSGQDDLKAGVGLVLLPLLVVVVFGLRALLLLGFLDLVEELGLRHVAVRVAHKAVEIDEGVSVLSARGGDDHILGRQVDPARLEQLRELRVLVLLFALLWELPGLEKKTLLQALHGAQPALEVLLVPLVSGPILGLELDAGRHSQVPTGS